jgi:hypothetical protein
VDKQSNTPATRTCTICGEEKSLSTEFGNQINGKYGKQSARKPCNANVIAEYRKTPRGKAKHREYARRHREKPGYNEKHKAYRDTPKAQWKIYQDGANKRGLLFEFTFEEFTNAFWQKPCAYCGEKLRTVGVDRVDNALGYTVTNTVPCCSTCNFMKLKTSREEFIRKCGQIARHCGLLCEPSRGTPPGSCTG